MMLIALLALPSDDLLFNISDGLLTTSDVGRTKCLLDDGYLFRMLLLRLTGVAVVLCCNSK